MSGSNKLYITDQKQIGEILKKRRKQLNITQKQLADLTDLSFNGISRVESGNNEIKISTLLKLAKFLGLEIIIELEEG